MAGTSGPGVSADNVIDLTGIDDEIENRQAAPTFHSTLTTRPSPAAKTRVIDIPRSHHGLLLIGPFGLHVARSTVAGLKRQASSTLVNSAKRQRLNGNRLKILSRQQYSDLPQVGSLKEVLRYQVFPHINKSLKPYGQQLDDWTRKEIGKKVANKLCKDGFTNHVLRNNGRLTADFEKEIAAKCKYLTEKLVGRALNEVPGNVSQTQGQLGVKNIGGLRGLTEKPQPVVIVLDDSSQSEDEVHTRFGALTLETPPLESHSTLPSSPATSFSADAAHDRRPSTPRSVADNEIRPHTTPRRSSRRTKTSAATDEPLILPSPPLGPPLLRSPVPILRESLTNRLRGNQHNVPKPSVHAASASKRLEVERLRLAGLDGDTPRPYLPVQARDDIRRALSLHASGVLNELSGVELKRAAGRVFHIDFTAAEVQCLAKAVESALEILPAKISTDPNGHLYRLITGKQGDIPRMVETMKVDELPPGRMKPDVIAFLHDVASSRISKQQPKMLRLQPISCKPNKVLSAVNSISSLLRFRESGGRRYIGSGHPSSSIKNILASLIEDTFIQEAEWTDCSGDVWAMVWMPGDRFVCGAITHSDSHNQQYNKPGNLLVGSVSKKSLSSIPGHRIPRPIVTSGDNSLNSMRETQDPWLYSTVTSAAYDCFSQKCFTSSYDRTVKVWDIASDGSSMDLCGTWEHQGVVNFVVTSPHHGRIATASDFCQDAIRVYDIDEENISESAYRTFSGERANEQLLKRSDSLQSWAYYPATIQWGKSTGVAHLLLAGYSPRSYDVNIGDIPDEKKNTGELCLWNTDDGSCIPVTSARTANVFEVIWHPTQPIFLASTSATGDFDDGVMTQIRIFGQSALGTFSHMKTLDCPGIDINEITCMPNSTIHCYVTASCTDGNTYVWDTFEDYKPIHVLSHSVSIDNPDNNLNSEDNGVKFAAWGRSVDRFYTGSSDGVVKSWDVRAPAGQEFVRDVLTLSGGISQGQFSPDCSKLLIGDSTGKVHLLTVESSLEPGENQPIYPRTHIKPHYEPLPPEVDENDIEIDPEPSAKQLAMAYIEKDQIRIIKDEYIGAVQGRKYASTGLFCPLEQHDPDWREKVEKRLYPKSISLARLPSIESSSSARHQNNNRQDNHQILNLDHQTRLQLSADRVDFDFEPDYKFDFEAESQIWIEEGDKLEVGARIDICFLGSDEIHQFLALKQKISQELNIQTQLENLRINLVDTAIK